MDNCSLAVIITIQSTSGEEVEAVNASLSIGIDFGTTNSSMAWYDPGLGQASIVVNAEGEAKTPSLVYYGEDEILVGKPVENELEDGRDYDPVVTTKVLLYDW